MSFKIYGNFSPDKIKVINNNVVVKNVDVNIPSYLNRKTTSGTLKEYLSARGNKFDRGLWQPPLVAELPDGSMKLFDGDHRRALWKAAYPEKKTLPAQIIKVNDKKEISDLFVVINKTGRKTLKPNEVFVHEVHSGNTDATQIESHLKFCNLKVSLGTNESGSSVGSTKGPEISITGFKKAIRMNSVQSVKHSSDLIRKLWPNNRSIGVELLSGISMVYNNTPMILRHANDFADYLSICKAVDTTQARVSTTFKREGGNKHNHHESCIALGVLSKFKNWSIANKRMSQKTFNKYYGSYMKSLKSELSD
tara:strand:- start:1407 stop:2330 length:924 start_codon:yes stop_codon:yes gene_type:complete